MIRKYFDLSNDAQINTSNYSYSSDFLVYKNCAYIRFGEIDFYRSVASGVRLKQVYRRSEIAEALGISEMQFVEWCILIGNDNTVVFPRRDFSAPSQDWRIFGGNSLETIDELFELIWSEGDGFMVTSDNTELQHAINYSRSCYELEDLSAFPFDVDAAYYSPVQLLDEQIRRFFAATLIRLSSRPSSPAAMNPCLELVIVLQDLVEEDSFDLLPEPDALSGIFSSNHVIGLRNMALDIGSGDIRTALPDTMQPSTPPAPPAIPPWDDVIAAYVFQKLCLELYETSTLTGGFDSSLSRDSLAQFCKVNVTSAAVITTAFPFFRYPLVRLYSFDLFHRFLPHRNSVQKICSMDLHFTGRWKNYDIIAATHHQKVFLCL